jgi:alkyl hydroperoxide reductase subunit AhpC
VPWTDGRDLHEIPHLERLVDSDDRSGPMPDHPADFTPVCSTEFMAFAGAYDDFHPLNTDLLGLSIDSTYSHIAWTRAIKEKFGVDIPCRGSSGRGLRVCRLVVLQEGAVEALRDRVDLSSSSSGASG